MRYKVSQEINSETKILPDINIFITDLIFLGGFLGGAAILRKGFVNEDFKIVYYLFSGVMALIMTLPSQKNPRRRNFQALLLYLKRERSIYKPVLAKEVHHEKQRS